MTYSEIQITFNDDLAVNDVLSINYTYNGGASIISETWKPFRSNSYQATHDLQMANAITGENSALNFVIAFQLDYNALGTYEVTRLLNVVTIKAKNPFIDFTNGVNSDCSFTITNFAGTALEVNNIEFLEASNPEFFVKIQVTTSVQIDNLIKPISQSISTNPFSFEVLRSGGVLPINLTIEGTTTEGQSFLSSVSIPNSLTAENTDIIINNSPNGATVLIFVNNSSGLDLEYSLDGANWQADNEFTGQSSGSYTIYVKDQLGASINKTFSISGVDNIDPYFYFPDTNSFRFVVESIGGVQTDKRIDENRLSCQDDVKLPYKIYQRFNIKDTIATQFKNNYETISIKIIDQDANETILSERKLTENRDLKDSRDCIMYNYDNARTGIYFTTGNKYNYDTGVDNGEDYALNGALPEWGIVGNYISIDNAWYQIEDIVFDDIKIAEVLIIGKIYTGVDAVKKVKIIYNREIYDVFEFDTIFSIFNNKVLEIEISLNSTNEDEVILRSEKIQVGDTADFKEIIFYNDTNTDILYSSGIKNKIWLRTEKENKKPSGESETHNTDTAPILLNATTREDKEFVFEAIPEAYMSKLFKGLHHTNLIIEGCNYVLKETPEVEGALEDTNLYELTAILTKGNVAYKAKTNNVGVPKTGDIIDVPALITIDTDGYIKI